MPIPIWALLGAGSALINGLATNSENKHEASEAKKANQMDAELAKWGWATRYGPKGRVSAKKKSVLGSMASGAFGGAMLGNNISDWTAAQAVGNPNLADMAEDLPTSAALDPQEGGYFSLARPRAYNPWGLGVK